MVWKFISDRPPIQPLQNPSAHCNLSQDSAGDHSCRCPVFHRKHLYADLSGRESPARQNAPKVWKHQNMVQPFHKCLKSWSCAAHSAEFLRDGCNSAFFRTWERGCSGRPRVSTVGASLPRAFTCPGGRPGGLPASMAIAPWLRRRRADAPGALRASQGLL